MFHKNNNLHSVLRALIDRGYFRETVPKVPEGFKSVEVSSRPISFDDTKLDLSFSRQFEFDVEKFYNFFEKEGIHPSLIPEKVKEWDISGWYNPIHFYGVHWGIFIREDSVYGIAFDLLNQIDSTKGSDYSTKIEKNLKDPHGGLTEEIKKETLKMEPYMGPLRSARSIENEYLASCIGIAYLMIYFHELFHHFVESFGIKSSITTNRPIYISYKDSIYKRYRHSDNNIEESLANAFSYLCISSLIERKIIGIEFSYLQKIVLDYMEKDFSNAPPGYRKAKCYLNIDRFEEALGSLMAIITEANLIV